MIPTLFIEMDKMPLTPSGKIDRKALPEPTFGEESKETYTAPNTTTEKQLITIWEELLNVSPIGIHDNFFKLGGHSLLAIRLVSHIQSAFEVTISIRDVFASPTIAALSTVISEGTQSAIPQIIVGKRPKYIPLSYAQERLWFIDKLQGSTAYHIPAVMRIPHEINIELLGKAMRKLVERHEALRTIFVEKDGIGYQEIISSEQFELNYISALPKNTSLETCIAQETSKAFDLSKDYMLRSTLIADTDGSHVLVLVVHHIASDGWSVPILAKELEALYEEFTTGKESNLPALPVQYADYSIWQRNYLSGETLDKKLAYWHNKLNGATPLELPTDFVRPAIQSMEGRVHNFVLNSELTTTLHQISKEQQATLFMTLISIYKVLLYRYTGQTDISIGTPIANREQQELEGLIGFFMNTIVLRDELESNADFNTLLAQVKETCLAAYEHQDVPFEQIVDNLNVERDQSRTPLFQTLFMLQNNEAVSEVSLGDAPVAEVATTHTTAKFDLTLNATETNGEILIQIEYATALFAEATITRMAKHFMLLTEAIAANTAQTISALPMIQEAEKQVLLEDFNQTEIAYASEKTVIDFFKAQVAKTPDATAICFEDQKLSYKELDEKSDALAQYLLSLGLAREELIPLCVDRSLEMMIAILGIQKAGAAYVPVDPNYPQDRIDFMLQDVKATKVVTTSNYATIFSASAEVSQIHVDNLPKREEQLEVSLNSQQLAYVFYTSGSTGTPKGVMIEHKALLNFLLSMSKTIDRESVKLLSVTAFTFDISILEFYYPLITGGQVYIANAIETTNPEALSQLINTFEPTCIQATPSRWQMIKDYGWTYNKDITLLSGGEPISKELTKYLIANATKVWNMYGPTETTIWSCEYQLINPDNISIGKPINNTQIYLLDDAHNLVPTGIAGELCIGGDGLARGYLNRSELTAEKFIPNPFRANKRIYKTGDLARWLPDGNLEFIGRKDDQVKLRGYRIELGEIEAVLDTIEAIQRAVVLVKKDTQGNAQLVGYITTTATIENKEIQEVLIEKLPEYMVPKLYMRLEEFPLTPNGKVNRKVLPLPDLTTQTVYVAPTTTTEKMLVTIWQELLQVSTIGIQHDFFELGGHSLLAIRLISQIQKQLQVTIDIRDVFAHSTIKSLATIIAESEVSSIPAIIPVKRPAQIPLSYAQERLWFIDQLQGSTAYHLSSILHVQGFDKTAFSKAVKALLDRHESLRTVFKEHDGIGYQSIMTSEAFTVNFVATLPQNETLENFIAYESNRPFDLSKEYMLRATLVQESDENQVLILVMHHIASDGWSIPILVKELELLYQGFVTGNEVELPALPIQYADYSIWQRNYLSGEILAKKLDYWTTKLQNTQALELPTDFVRPSIQSTEGKSYGFLLNKEIASGLNNISKAQNTTLFMTLLSIYKVLLYRYTGQTDISVGTPIANRHQEEVAGLIGFFMNTIVLRDELDAKASFAALLQQIKETCLEGYSHQDVPFEQIVDALSLERDRSTTPLFQTLFVLQNNESVDEVQVDNNSLQSRGNTSTTSKFDITTTMTETSEGIVVEFEYATALFKEETIVRMASHLEMLAKAVIENIQELIATLALLPTKETNTILNDFSTCEVSYDDSQTIVSLFETQVAKTPNARALVYQDLELNYSELDQKSNQVAHYLIEKGITKNTLVPLCMNPSLETIIALFGILKAGAAYVPIDPIFPTERIEYILKDCNADLLLSTTKTILPQTILEDISVIHLDEFAYEKYEVSKPAIDIFLDDLIYVIYTSGTTGNPKGVQIQHGALLDYVHGLCDKADLQACQSFALITSIAADVVNTALYPPFMLGGELHILPKETIMDAEAMSKVSVDCAKVVPSHWYSLQSEVYHFIPKKCILFGGEALKEEMLAFLRSQNFQGDVYNHYGPTETTVGKLINKINLETSLDKIPLGKPFGNTQIFILDENDQLCPIGIHGELCIAGAGLAKGYVNQPTLTEEKFITTNINNTITRIYKTGDVARWLPSGEVEFLGRKDHQIKIRGYRVELNEIASILEESKEIKQAIVTAIEDTSGSKQLVGYVVLDTEISSEEMQRRLQEKLPEYMIPKSFMRLEAFPLTSNGKINRKQLPTQTLVQQRSDYVAPRTAVEAKLVSIWEALLNVAKIGIHDNFFELGGDSIKAIQLVSRSKFAGLNYMVKDIFAYQTIAEIAQHIKNNTGNILVEKGVLEGNVSLHPIQKDFFERNYAVPNHYNQSVLLTIEKSIDKTTLEEAIRVLTLQHDALRLQFTETENTYPTQTYTVQHARLHVETIVSTEEIHAVCSQHQASLEISNADITRFVLLETPENEAQNRLLIAVHHLAIDGISWRILLEDFMMLVEKIQGKQSYTLPEKATSYRQWTEKLAAYANSEALAAEYEFWKETVASYTEIPSNSSETTTSEAQQYAVQLSKEQTELLVRDVNSTYQTEINDILLSALAMSFKNWHQAEQLMIHLEGHGREELFDDVDIYRTIGWFTTLYPVSLKIPQTNNLESHIINTKNSLRAIPNKGIGYSILRHLATSEVIQKTLKIPQKDIVFNYLGSFDNTTGNSDRQDNQQLIGFASESKGLESALENQSPYKLAINGMISDGQLQFEWQYNTKDFTKETIATLSEAFITALEAIISHCTSVEGESVKNNEQHLILFQSEGNGVPLYLIPPLGGTSSVLEEFASYLGNDRPIYGIEMEGLFEGETPFTTIKEIAAHNIKRIKAAQPNGPYVFMGYSFGGSVAYEMAKQFEEANEEALPILLDQPAFFEDSERDSAEEIAKRAVEGISESITEAGQDHKLAENWETALAQDLDITNVEAAWQTVIDFLRANKIEFTNDIEVLGRVFKLFLTNTNLSYLTEGKLQKMLLVRSERDPKEFTDHLGWEHFVDTIHLVQATGNHHTLIREENGKQLANVLREKIQKLTNEHTNKQTNE
jgi:amino acid adenylation domain-containing protein/non-ribosomal peptide synthase protein (TIGR01720 family)